MHPAESQSAISPGTMKNSFPARFSDTDPSMRPTTVLPDTSVVRTLNSVPCTATVRSPVSTMKRRFSSFATLKNASPDNRTTRSPLPIPVFSVSVVLLRMKILVPSDNRISDFPRIVEYCCIRSSSSAADPPASCDST